jgi:filamentous hemagglutinin family protein
MFSASSIRFPLLLSTAVAAPLALPSGATAQNLPQNGTFATAPAGDITTSPSGTTMTVNLRTQRSIINWNSFDIGNGYTVDFDGDYYGGVANAVLNRVLLNNVSDINGNMTSDPYIQVFLINPNGIIFGSTASVDVGSFVASTLGITDSDFLLGDAVPTELTFQGNVSTGITVNGGAQLTTESGPLALIGGFIDVQSGSIVNGATDVAFVAANSVNIPADPGSPLTYAITTFAPTSVSNGITVGGQVSGRSVALIQENQADAVGALLFVSPSATITATKGGGGDIVLSLAARTTSEGTPADSPGHVENHGDLTASGSIYLGGAVASSSGEFHAPQSGETIGLYLPQTVENDGTLDAGGDVLMQARHNVTNSGSIIAGDYVTLSAFASTSASSPDLDVEVTNSGDITAGGDVTLSGSISISDIATDTIALNPSVQVVNDGPITAGGNVTLNGTIDISSLAGSNIDVAADVKVSNSSSIDADGDVNLHAAATLSEFTSSDFVASQIDAAVNVEITNSGTIKAGGDAWINGGISISTFSATNIDATANLKITNSGNITAGSDAWLSGSIEVGSFAASHIDVAPDLEITNSGTIDASGSAAWISGYIQVHDLTGLSVVGFEGLDIHATPNLQITNSGTIEAGDVAWIRGETHLSSFAASTIDVAPTLEITNRGTVKAGSAAWISASMNLSDFDADDIKATPNLAITNSGNLTASAADGSAWLSGGIEVDGFSGGSIEVAANVDVTNSGTLKSGGAASINAWIDISSLSAPSTSVSSNANVINRGTVIAGGDGFFRSDGNITNSGVISVDGVATLDAVADIDNSGSIAAGGDAILTAGGDILDSSGTLAGSISGADVALSAGGSITAGTVTARDDIAIRAPGPVTTLNLTSGATIGSLGPVDVAGAADQLLPGVDLSGHDVDVDGSTIAANVIRAFGPGSDIRLRAPVTASREDLDFAAGGNVTVESDLAATDVAIDAGGTITAGNISARDDLALRAGDTLNVGTLTSGVAIDGTGPVDTAGAADALLGADLAGHDLFVQGGHVSLTQATANGTGSDLTIRATTGDLTIVNGTAGGMITLAKEGTTGILTAGTLLAGTGASLTSTTDIDADRVETVSGDLNFAAGGDVTVHNPLAADDVAIDAGGTITTGAITARDDIALRAGNTLNVGTLTSGVAIGGTGPIDGAGAADTLLGATLTGHDVFVQGGTVSLTQAAANGTNSDLTVRATTGGLSITNGSAGGTITLTKEGTTGILTAGTLLAGTGATLTSATDIDAQTVQTVSGDLAFSAGRDVTVHSPLAADDVAIDAGRNIATQNISARDDIAIRAGGTLDTGTLASGVTIGGTGPVDTAGVADTLLNDTLAGHDISVQAADVSLTDATANGTGSDLTVRAASGNLSIDNGVAGGSVNLDAAHLVTLGTVTAQAGNVNILADDLDILLGLSGQEVSITNRGGGNAVTVLGDASAPGAFTLTEAELNRINAPIVNIDSLDQNLLVGNVAFDNEIGSTRINLLGTGRADIVGEIDASGVNRTLQIGGTTGAASPTDPATLASIIRIAPMSSGGGRIILGSGSLDLRGAKIGVGLDDGFLSPLGLIAGGSPVSTAIVQQDWIGNFDSTLYGIPGGYADPVVISAGSITVTYTDYALFQNTAGKGLPSGVNADNLFIVSSGDDGNGFELFGSIDQVGGVGAAFLVKPTTVSLGNSRINGCLILTGGGCGSTPGVPPIDTVDPSVPPPGGNDGDGDLFGAVGDQFAQQDLVSTDEDQAFSFDSLVGTNNEGLLGVMGVDDSTVQPCAPDDKRDTCQVEEKPHAQ